MTPPPPHALPQRPPPPEPLPPSEVLRRAKEIFLQSEDADVYECLGLASKEFVVHPDVHTKAFDHLWAARVGQFDQAIELAAEAEE